eukprot:comp18499_c0_seq1/m.19878 comp18499_c0_seq1/g.19878  ORF comp18499_c0_seq1/g.19878 comp18499_c0_seq1/m.19878 type:complete len:482 (-) comp18499_c0_seq1:461-1906(-)
MAETSNATLGGPAQETTPLMDSSIHPAHVHRQRPTLVTMSAAALAGMGAPLLFGFGLTVLNTSRQAITDYFYTKKGHHVTDLEWSFVVSAFCIGGLLGSLLVGHYAQYGRKLSLVSNNAWFLSGAVLMCLANNVYVMALGRLLYGVGAGVGLMLVPMYLTDIAPPHLRGTFAGITQIGIAVGILLGQVLGLSTVLGTIEYWRILVALPVVSAVVNVMFFPFCSESPSFMLRHMGTHPRGQDKGDGEETPVLSDDGDSTDDSDRFPTKQLGYMEMLRQPDTRWLIAIGMGLQFVQQWTGINALNYYSTPMLAKAGVPHPDLATVAYGAANIPAGLLCMAIIDRFPRRRLLLASLVMMGVCYVLLGASMVLGSDSDWPVWVAIVSMVVINVAYDLAAAPMPTLVMTEMFTADMVGDGMALCGTANWGLNFAIGFGFLHVEAWLGNAVMFIFAASCLLLAIFVYFCLPETRGTAPGDIRALYKK